MGALIVARRGFSLVEILVGLVIFGLIGSMGFYVLNAQNRNWKTESDNTSVQMMAKGTLDELTRAVRMTGSGLPDGGGGMRVFGAGEERATFVMNESGGSGVVQGWIWDRNSGLLRLKVDTATKFSYGGYARLDLKVPPRNVHSATPGRVLNFTFPVVDRMVTNVAGSSACGDSLILNAKNLLDSGWTNSTDVQGFVNGAILNIDSVTYRRSHDTLIVRRNTLGDAVLALGVDEMRFQYFHPTAGWLDSLSGAAPANQVLKVRIRLVLRTLAPDSKLKSVDPASRGYRFSKMETEVGVRASVLTNQ